MEQSMNMDMVIQKCWDVLNNSKVKIEKPEYNICYVYLNNKEMFSVAESMLFIKSGFFVCTEASKMYAKCEELFKPTRDSIIRECVEIMNNPNISIIKSHNIYKVFLKGKHMFDVGNCLLFTDKGHIECSTALTIFEKCENLYKPIKIAKEKQKQHQEEENRKKALEWFKDVQLTPRQTLVQTIKNWFSKERN